MQFYHEDCIGVYYVDTNLSFLMFLQELSKLHKLDKFC